MVLITMSNGVDSDNFKVVNFGSCQLGICKAKDFFVQNYTNLPITLSIQSSDETYATYYFTPNADRYETTSDNIVDRDIDCDSTENPPRCKKNVAHRSSLPPDASEYMEDWKSFSENCGKYMGQLVEASGSMWGWGGGEIYDGGWPRQLDEDAFSKRILGSCWEDDEKSLSLWQDGESDSNRMLGRFSARSRMPDEMVPSYSENSHQRKSRTWTIQPLSTSAVSIAVFLKSAVLIPTSCSAFLRYDWESVNMIEFQSYVDVDGLRHYVNFHSQNEGENFLDIKVHSFSMLTSLVAIAEAAVEPSPQLFKHDQTLDQHKSTQVGNGVTLSKEEKRIQRAEKESVDDSHANYVEPLTVPVVMSVAHNVPSENTTFVPIDFCLVNMPNVRVFSIQNLQSFPVTIDVSVASPSNLLDESLVRVSILSESSPPTMHMSYKGVIQSSLSAPPSAAASVTSGGLSYGRAGSRSGSEGSLASVVSWASVPERGDDVVIEREKSPANSEKSIAPSAVNASTTDATYQVVQVASAPHFPFHHLREPFHLCSDGASKEVSESAYTVPGKYAISHVIGEEIFSGGEEEEELLSSSRLDGINFEVETDISRKDTLTGDVLNSFAVDHNKVKKIQKRYRDIADFLGSIEQANRVAVVVPGARSGDLRDCTINFLVTIQHNRGHDSRSRNDQVGITLDEGHISGASLSRDIMIRVSPYVTAAEANFFNFEHHLRCPVPIKVHSPSPLMPSPPVYSSFARSRSNERRLNEGSRLNASAPSTLSIHVLRLGLRLCESDMTLLQKNVNFGKIIVGNVVYREVVLLNKSATIPCLYSISKSGSIASGFLSVPRGRKGCIEPASSVTLGFLFKPALPGSFEEVLTVENVLNPQNSQFIVVKAKVSKPHTFELQPFNPILTTHGSVKQEAVPGGGSGGVVDYVDGVLEVKLAQLASNGAPDESSPAPQMSPAVHDIGNISAVPTKPILLGNVMLGESCDCYISFRLKNVTAKTRQFIVDASHSDSITLVPIFRRPLSSSAMLSSGRAFSSFEVSTEDEFSSEYLSSIVTLHCRFEEISSSAAGSTVGAEPSSPGKAKCAAVVLAADATRAMEDKLEFFNQKLKIARRKNKLDKIAKYETKIKNIIFSLSGGDEKAGENNSEIDIQEVREKAGEAAASTFNGDVMHTSRLPTDVNTAKSEASLQSQSSSIAIGASDLTHHFKVNAFGSVLIRIRITLLPGPSYKHWEDALPFVGCLRVFECRNEDVVKTIRFGAKVFSRSKQSYFPSTKPLRVDGALDISKSKEFGGAEQSSLDKEDSSTGVCETVSHLREVHSRLGFFLVTISQWSSYPTKLIFSSYRHHKLMESMETASPLNVLGMSLKLIQATKKRLLHGSFSVASLIPINTIVRVSLLEDAAFLDDSVGMRDPARLSSRAVGASAIGAIKAVIKFNSSVHGDISFSEGHLSLNPHGTACVVDTHAASAATSDTRARVVMTAPMKPCGKIDCLVQWEPPSDVHFTNEVLLTSAVHIEMIYPETLSSSGSGVEDEVGDKKGLVLYAQVAPLVCLLEHSSSMKLDKYLNIGEIPLGRAVDCESDSPLYASVLVSNTSASEDLHYLTLVAAASSSDSTTAHIDIISGHTGVLAPMASREIRIRFTPLAVGKYEQELWVSNLVDQFDQKRCVVSATVVLPLSNFIVFSDALGLKTDDGLRLIDFGLIQLKHDPFLGWNEQSCVASSVYRLRIRNVSGHPLAVSAVSNLKKQCFIYTDEDCTQAVIYSLMPSVDEDFVLYVVLKPTSFLPDTLVSSESENVFGARSRVSSDEVSVDTSFVVNSKRVAVTGQKIRTKHHREKYKLGEYDGEKAAQTHLETQLLSGREITGGVRLIFYAVEDKKIVEPSMSHTDILPPSFESRAAEDPGYDRYLNIISSDSAASISDGRHSFSKLIETTVVFKAVVGASKLKASSSDSSSSHSLRQDTSSAGLWRPLIIETRVAEPLTDSLGQNHQQYHTGSCTGQLVLENLSPSFPLRYSYNIIHSRPDERLFVISPLFEGDDIYISSLIEEAFASRTLTFNKSGYCMVLVIFDGDGGRSGLDLSARGRKQVTYSVWYVCSCGAAVGACSLCGLWVRQLEIINTFTTEVQMFHFAAYLESHQIRLGPLPSVEPSEHPLTPLVAVEDSALVIDEPVLVTSSSVRSISGLDEVRTSPRGLNRSQEEQQQQQQQPSRSLVVSGYRPHRWPSLLLSNSSTHNSTSVIPMTTLPIEIELSTTNQSGSVLNKDSDSELAKESANGTDLPEASVTSSAPVSQELSPRSARFAASLKKYPHLLDIQQVDSTGRVKARFGSGVNSSSQDRSRFKSAHGSLSDCSSSDSSPAQSKSLFNVTANFLDEAACGDDSKGAAVHSLDRSQGGLHSCGSPFSVSGAEAIVRIRLCLGQAVKSFAREVGLVSRIEDIIDDAGRVSSLCGVIAFSSHNPQHQHEKLSSSSSSSLLPVLSSTAVRISFVHSKVRVIAHNVTRRQALGDGEAFAVLLTIENLCHSTVPITIENIPNWFELQCSCGSKRMGSSVCSLELKSRMQVEISVRLCSGGVSMKTTVDQSSDVDQSHLMLLRCIADIECAVSSGSIPILGPMASRRFSGSAGVLSAVVASLVRVDSSARSVKSMEVGGFSGIWNTIGVRTKLEFKKSLPQLSLPDVN